VRWLEAQRRNKLEERFYYLMIISNQPLLIFQTDCHVNIWCHPNLEEFVKNHTNRVLARTSQLFSDTALRMAHLVVLPKRGDLAGVVLQVGPRFEVLPGHWLVFKSCRQGGHHRNAIAERLDKEGQVEQLLKGTASEKGKRQSVRLPGGFRLEYG
jgi:hypothetical protein